MKFRDVVVTVLSLPVVVPVWALGWVLQWIGKMQESSRRD